MSVPPDHAASNQLMSKAVTEDINYIESQNRGLQVQTSNQQALLDELRQLLVSYVTSGPAHPADILANR